MCFFFACDFALLIRLERCYPSGIAKGSMAPPAIRFVFLSSRRLICQYLIAAEIFLRQYFQLTVLA
ncbi:hypothetical protein DES54_11246 [Brenneria salicis ATCC 15712 = DSM 30166]|uniref:Uncharacterized protein n=1 Tax=Brenneria salicis ATCC 15712 = DSM 30166 TaxID=714314 RepID=A0A366I6M0_9GAMM|nr:hypothetical protein DES54_11246 [Brenneria salicis ATCC 15712 = DSM 30166]